MLIPAYRIVRSEYAQNAFDGEGARLYGGRWSSPGTPMVYASGSVPLAMLEVLVHLPVPRVLDDYVLIGIEIPRQLIEQLPARRLPKEWREWPAPISTQRIGERWAAKSKNAILQVPSVLDPGSHNYLLNPRHTAFKRIRIAKPQRFPFDSRLAR